METITAEVTGEHVLKTYCRRPRIARTSPIVVPAASAGSRWLLARHSWLRQGVVPGRILDPTTSAELRRPAAQTVSTPRGGPARCRRSRGPPRGGGRGNG